MGISRPDNIKVDSTNDGHIPIGGYPSMGSHLSPLSSGFPPTFQRDPTQDSGSTSFVKPTPMFDFDGPDNLEDITSNINETVRDLNVSPNQNVEAITEDKKLDELLCSFQRISEIILMGNL